MGTSETIDRKRERAPEEGAIDSDNPTQPLGKKCRVGYPHVAFLADKEVVRGRAQWWHFEMREKVDTQPRQNCSAPSVINRGGSVLSACFGAAFLEKATVFGPGIASECMQALRERQRRGNRMHGDSSKSVHLWELAPRPMVRIHGGC